MPEGPELLHSRDRLRALLIDPRNVTVNDKEPLGPAMASFYPFRGENRFFSGRYEKEPPVGFTEFYAESAAFQVKDVSVKGKLMWWEVDTGKSTWWMHCTYGMSGRWEVRSLTTPATKHTAAWIRFSRESKNWCTDGSLLFLDQRHFGTLKFINDAKQHQKKLASLGPDMLSDPPDDEAFVQRLQKRANKTISEALMDQGCISGVGNYIKAEALYRARISPHRQVNDLLLSSGVELHLLRQAIIDVMQESYRAKGATLRSYRTADSEPGEAQFTFRVYGKKVDPHGNAVITETTKDGRTTHWVPNVQH